MTFKSQLRLIHRSTLEAGMINRKEDMRTTEISFKDEEMRHCGSISTQ
jgi:hypothetical protein